MERIEIDFDVFKALTGLRETEDMTYNDVLRKILNLSKKTTTERPPSGEPFLAKGVTFPHGTEFRAHYKGQIHTARVENGAIMAKDRKFSSLSAAAMFVTQHPRDGWIFWEAKSPGQTSWVICDRLRTR